jgi:2-methylcitrate dehydratase
VRGQVTVDEITEETVNDPVIQGLIPKLRVEQDTELYQKVTNSMPGRITIRTTDGREFTDEVLYPKGNPGNRLTEDEFKDKFMRSVVRVLGEEQSEELYNASRDLANVDDVATLAPLFSRK